MVARHSRAVCEQSASAAGGAAMPGAAPCPVITLWRCCGVDDARGCPGPVCLRGSGNGRAPPLGVLAFTARAAGLGAAGPAGHRGRGRAVVRVEHHQRRAGPVLLGRGEEHVGELEGVLLRRLRSRGHDHDRQARRIVPAAGPVGPHLRLPPVVAGAAAGHRGRHLGAADVPRGAALGRCRAGAAGRQHLRPDADRGVHVRAQHGGRRADHVPGARGRLLPARGHECAAALAGVRWRVGRPGFPGQDDAGVDGPAGPGHRLPAVRARAVAPPAVASGRRRPGDARGVAVVDRAIHPHARRRPALRGRLDRQQRGGHGVRLQRTRTLRCHRPWRGDVGDRRGRPPRRVLRRHEEVPGYAGLGRPSPGQPSRPAQAGPAHGQPRPARLRRLEGQRTPTSTPGASSGTRAAGRSWPAAGSARRSGGCTRWRS